MIVVATSATFDMPSDFDFLIINGISFNKPVEKILSRWYVKSRFGLWCPTFIIGHYELNPLTGGLVPKHAKNA